MFGLGPTELVVIVFLLAPLALVVWGIADAASRPDHAWAASGQNKTLWVVLLAVSLLFCGVGAILSIVYLTAVRPKVAAAQARP